MEDIPINESELFEQLGRQQIVGQKLAQQLSRSENYIRVIGNFLKDKDLEDEFREFVNKKAEEEREAALNGDKAED